MGESFITRRGGGIPYAIIGVTYPSGSICTCTNGTRTLTGKDTSGKALFVIPAAGTWMVKAVKGSNSASKAVKITAEGQVETVKLAYDLILFDGTDNTAVTGGLKLQVGTYDSAVVSSAPISGGKITFNKTGYVGVYPAKKADITKYSTLRVELNFPVDSLYVALAGIISTDATPQEAMNASGGKHVAYQDLVKGANSLAIPVDKFSGSYQFLLAYYSDNGGQVSISNIRFT